MYLSCVVCLVKPSLSAGHQGCIGSIGGLDSTKVPSTHPSCWELICCEFNEFFDKPHSPPEREIKYKIDLLPDSFLSAKKYYGMSPLELFQVRKQLDEYFSKGWIGPSTCPFGAPILLARKKHGTLRICIGYRALSWQTRPDKYLLLRVHNLLDWLVNANCLSNIDLHTGYHQVAIRG